MHTDTGFHSLIWVQCARAAAMPQSSGQPERLMARLSAGMSLVPGTDHQEVGAALLVYSKFPSAQ